MNLFHVIATLLVAGSISTTAAQARILQANDAFALEYASDVRISPDGDQVLYVRNGADVQKDERVSSVWMIDLASGAQSQIAHDSRTAYAPRWSPSGDRFAYLSAAEGKHRIIVHDVETGGKVAEIALAAPARDLTWSPDGRLLAFASFVKEDSFELAPRFEPPEGAEWKDPAYVTDDLIYRLNQGLGEPGSEHVFLVPALGGEPRRITPDGFSYGTQLGSGGGMTWNADGTELIVSANFGARAEFTPLDTDLYAYSADGRQRQISDRPGPENQPRLSPDGRWLAYLGFDDRSQGFQNTHVFVLPVGGGEARAVTEALDRSILDYHWAPDGRGLYVSYDDEGVTKLGHVTLSGEHEELQSGLGGGFGLSAYGGELGAGPFSVARNGQYGLVMAGSHRPGDVGVSEGSEPLRRITDLNGDALADVTLGRVDAIEYRSSHDGQEIGGWLILPPQFDPTRKYPLILEIHGGPFTNYGPRFDIEKQLMAAAGYVVLYVNPRGSTSYGEAFGNAIHHAFPGDDYHDLVSGVDHVIGQGFVDPERLYVAGGSGGGLLAAWIISHTDRFDAAALHYPVVDWATEVLTSDLPTYMLQYWFPAPPWQAREHYEGRSPLSLIDRVRTPALVLVGEEDLRTPVSQAEMYYMALKLRGIESVLIRIPDEGHGTRTHPSHQLSKVMNTLAWFDRHGER